LTKFCCRGHVREGEGEQVINVYSVFMTSDKKKTLGDLGVDGGMIFTRILNKWGVRV
jgi:hypothetical protein